MRHHHPTDLPADVVWVTPAGIRGVLLKDRWFTNYQATYSYLKQVTGDKDMTEEGFHNLIRRMYRCTSASDISRELFNRTRQFLWAPELGRLIRNGDTNWDRITLDEA